MIELAKSNDPSVLRMLASHPHVTELASGEKTLEFWSPRYRQVIVGDPSIDPSGLLELMDNNPLICADTASVPDAASTLALIGLGPALCAGLVVEPPTMVVNCAAHEDTVAAFLQTCGWMDGVTLQAEETGSQVLAATLIAAIRTPENLDDIDALYGERYDRSFYVRRDESSAWAPELVLAQPYALYRLRIAQDQPFSLLTIQVIADRDGKCGAAQVIHCMNVMSGQEESLGIA